METNMKSKKTHFSLPNLSCTLIAWMMTFCLVVQGITPAFAVTLPSETIQSDVLSNPAFVRDETDPDYQYVGSPYVSATAPVGGDSIEEFLDDVIENYDYAVGGPTYVPVGVGDVTTIIPIYQNYKLIGDELVQARYVRAQIRTLLGRSLIDTRAEAGGVYATEAAQLNTLYQNALSYVSADGSVRVGDNLGWDQDGATNSSGQSMLGQPMIWPELRTIHGEQVLVPILYLTAMEMQRKVTGNQTEFGDGGTFGELDISETSIQLDRGAFLDVVGDLSIQQGQISGGGDLSVGVGGSLQSLSSLIRAQGDLTIRVGGELLNLSSAIESDEDLTIRVDGQVLNLSGLIRSQGDLAIAAKSIESRTIVHQYRGAQESYFGEISRIESEDGSVVLRTSEDIVLAGSEVSAGEDIRFAADGSIYIGTVNITESYSNSSGGWRTNTGGSIEYLGSSLTAEQSIELIANSEILIDASEIVAENGHIEMLAGLGITIIDELNATQSYQQGQFGKTSKEISAYKTVAIRSLLDAGKGINLHTEFGDITLKAVDISSTEGTSVTASNGAINLLVTKETDHYSYSSVKESLFTTKTINRGHDIETVVPTTIIGGFEANPLYGLNVEYEGDPDFTFNQQVNALAQMLGLEWMAEVRNSSDVNWAEVESKYEQWNDTSRTLSPAAIALISIVVVVATGGAGAFGNSLLGAAEGATVTATASAVGAASISLVTASAIASANAVLNGENPFDAAFDTLTDSDALRSAAIAAVTAGAIASIDADFFNASEIGAENATSGLVDQVLDANGVFTGEFTLSLGGQALQAVTHATVSAGVQNLAYGGDFSDLFQQALTQNAINVIGEHMASTIAGTFDVANPTDLETALRYISHAGAGCILGAATASTTGSETDSGCYSGAGGAVIGELVASHYRTTEEYVEARDALQEFVDDQVTSVDGLSSDPTILHSQLRSFENYRDLYENVNELRLKGINLGQLGAALGAFISGGDAAEVNIAAFTGQNAAENSGLRLEVASAFAAVLEVVQDIEIRTAEIQAQIADLTSIAGGVINASLEVGIDGQLEYSLDGQEASVVDGQLVITIDNTATQNELLEALSVLGNAQDQALIDQAQAHIANILARQASLNDAIVQRYTDGIMNYHYGNSSSSNGVVLEPLSGEQLGAYVRTNADEANQTNLLIIASAVAIPVVAGEALAYTVVAIELGGPVASGTVLNASIQADAAIIRGLGLAAESLEAGALTLRQVTLSLGAGATAAIDTAITESGVIYTEAQVLAAQAQTLSLQAAVRTQVTVGSVPGLAGFSVNPEAPLIVVDTIVEVLPYDTPAAEYAPGILWNIVEGLALDLFEDITGDE